MEEMRIIAPDEIEEIVVPAGITKLIINPKTVCSKHVELRITEIKPGKAHESHTHEVDEILIVISGKLKERVKGETRIVVPSEVVYIPAGVKHNGEAFGDEPLRMYVVFAPPLKKPAWEKGRV